MPSMSYCMFENTAGEMGQVINRMSECNSIEDLNHNEYEQRAFRVLYEQCQEYIAMYRTLAAEFIED